MTGGVELTVLAVRVALIVGLYAFVGLVLLVIWRDAHSSSPPATAADDVRVARLVVLDPGASGLELGTEFPLRAGMTIGRGEPNSIIPTPRSPRQHGRIAFRQGGWWAKDPAICQRHLRKRPRVEEPTPLEDGDELEVAQVRLRMEIT
jgi:hypothetical protein